MEHHLILIMKMIMIRNMIMMASSLFLLHPVIKQPLSARRVLARIREDWIVALKA